ncbi:hypothetical protein [Pseudarthrobacter sp. S3]|uniref:hypothetical protein n=1 Tax=unclassified Pseudarthrobacter TaxID=2647000 RepID=UPI003CF1AA79
MYFRRCVARLPAAGEIIDCSYYNRSGVERAMGFCTEDQDHSFLSQPRPSIRSSPTMASTS